MAFAVSRDFIVRRARRRDAHASSARERGRAEPGGWLITTTNWRSVADERRYLRSLRRYAHAAVFVAEDREGIIGRL